jgi:hypothetical protein
VLGRLLLLVCVIFAATAAAALAHPVATATTPAESMVLTTADFPAGASVLLERAVPTYLPARGYSSAYTRALEQVMVGNLQITSLVSSAEKMQSPAIAAKFISSLAAQTKSPATRAALLAAMKKIVDNALGNSKAKPVTTKLLRARTLDVGDGGVDIVLELDTSAVSFEIGEVYVRQGQGLEIVQWTTGPPGIPANEDVALARLAVSHMQKALLPAPANTAVPTITGTLQPGQIATATPGAWSGPQPTFTYQWSACNAVGQSCTAIPNATQATYTISVANVGQSLEVSVTATTLAGQGTAQSSATQPVTSA